MRILIVDDSQDSRELVSRCLHEAGFDDVVQAGSSEDAIRLLTPRRRAAVAPPGCDLILLDIGLPGMDGLRACRRFRTIRHLRDVPIIIITGRVEEELLEAAFSAGAADYVSKPFRCAELIARVRLALKRKADHEKQAVKAHELEIEVGHDPLTGLANRRTFETALRGEWRRAAREAAPLSLIMADVDYFHAYNACYGHLEGDRALQLVGRVLSGSARRGGDLVVRYGGEEFSLLLPQTDPAGAQALAAELRAAIEKLALPHPASRCGSVLTTSFGVATLVPSADKQPTQLVAIADSALFRAKRAGRNRVEHGNDFDMRPIDPTSPLPVLDRPTGNYGIAKS